MNEKLERVKARFTAEGISIAEWARSNGFKSYLVYRVLDGTCKATRGETHRIAVALGLKSEPNHMKFRQMLDVA